MADKIPRIVKPQEHIGILLNETFQVQQRLTQTLKIEILKSIVLWLLLHGAESFWPNTSNEELYKRLHHSYIPGIMW